MQFDNSYMRLGDGFSMPARPDHAPSATLLSWNESLAFDLGFDTKDFTKQDLAEIFSGNRVLCGMQPVALAYSGHQFGHFAGQLGDGRACLLGEVISATGERYDLQLKGSGPTAFSRGGDGKAPLGPVLREYVISEFMHRIGVPTTRSLAAVATGEQVQRENLQPGAVVTRVAKSHIRIGTFEHFASRQDVTRLHKLIAYSAKRHLDLDAPVFEQAHALLADLCQKLAILVAQWQGVGFVHGVMNTDNIAISGETIDYGPCAFMEAFAFDRVFSSIDHSGRYAYDKQSSIAKWNLARFAEALLYAWAGQSEQTISEAHSEFIDVLSGFDTSYEKAFSQVFCVKMGVAETDGASHLIKDWLQLLQAQQLDFTLSFRLLKKAINNEPIPAQYRSIEEFVGQRRQLWAEQHLVGQMDDRNPLYIPRNHLIARVIASAEKGDMQEFHKLGECLKEPYTESPNAHVYAAPADHSELVLRTFCGT